MDPITTAIVAALPALASDMVKNSVKDAYAGLKAVIRRKWGEQTPAAKAVEALEANPQSKGQAAVLAEHVAATNATADADVMQAVARLLDALRKEGLGGKAVAAITVNIGGGTQQGIVGAENVSIGTMNFGAPSTRKA